LTQTNRIVPGVSYQLVASEGEVVLDFERLHILRPHFTKWSAGAALGVEPPGDGLECGLHGGCRKLLAGCRLLESLQEPAVGRVNFTQRKQNAMRASFQLVASGDDVVLGFEHPHILVP
jgi:hypothetical protein